MQMIANSKTLSAMLEAKRDRSSGGKGKPRQGKAQLAQAATRHLEEDDEEAMCAYNLFGVETDEEPPEPYYATITIRGQDIKFETDSGATASVISEETYRRTWESDPEAIPQFSKAQFSRWVAPIVSVLKADKTATICGDYKLTV